MYKCLAKKSSELGNGKETCSLSLHHYQYIAARFLLLLLLLPRVVVVVVVVAVVVVFVWFRGLCHSYHNLRDHVFNNVQYHVDHCISHHMSSSSQFHCSTASVISYSIQYITLQSTEFNESTIIRQQTEWCASSVCIIPIISTFSRRICKRLRSNSSRWWFFPTHLKNMRKSNWIISPGFWGENQKNV